MSTVSINDFLDSPLLEPKKSVEDLFVKFTEEETPILLAGEGEIDPRLRLLSHSSRLTLHKCPRKYQLYRLKAQANESATKDPLQQLTFDYGTVVGIGIQEALEGKTEEQIFLAMLLAWEGDLLIENPKQKKSFWLAMHAVQQFLSLRAEGYLEDYELVSYNGRPAVELSFEIILGEFVYRGFVDAVLQHTLTGEIVVLECKTSSSANINSASYKNSGQAIGYSVVLDKIFPDYSSYSVLYLVYSTKGKEYTELPFDKSLLQRALWLQDLLLDTKMIELYEEYGSYPIHGESCFDFYRECEYLGLCTLSTERLTAPLTVKVLADIEKDMRLK